MGHAGAIISAFGETAEEKVIALKNVGINIINKPSEFGKTVSEVLKMNSILQ